MTRFARAKGSKASNEKVPDEPTPWHIMKQDLQSSKKKDGESTKKNKSVKELLNSDELLSRVVVKQNVNTDWAEFENQTSKRKTEEDENSKPPKKKKDSKQRDGQKKDVEADKMRKEEDNPDPRIKKNNKRKRTSTDRKQDETKNMDTTDPTNSVEGKKQEPFVIMSKRQKRNLKHKSKGTDSTASPTENTNSVAKPERGKNFKSHNTTKNGFSNKRNNVINKNNIKKPPKIKDLKEFKRRKPDIGETSMTINGMEVQLTKYDGFPVKKEDAERLKELKQKMILKGIPKSEINFAMKLERRKAEKALARLKKCVCFHCRKSGHNLSDCPELGREQHATGICYKCGSTEHTHFECKVNKSTEFRFATCFICREQGHISKQCPDNPKGVYPDGGCCKICGDVTHLRKDCPDLVKAKEESTLTADKIDDSNLECL